MEEKRRKKQLKKSNDGKFLSAVVGFLFVILILLAVAVSFDYILFAFHRTPVFAVKAVEAEKTEHIGLVYVVTESGQDLTWDWIWAKFNDVP